MSDDEDADDDEYRARRSVNVTFPETFLREELLPAYPAATRTTQAIRMAVQEAVRGRQHRFAGRDLEDQCEE